MEHPLLRAATVPLMLLVGALITLQSRVNGSLAGQLGEGLRAGALAAVVSFGSGLLLLSVVVLSHPRRRAGLRRVLDALRDPAAGGDRPRLRPVHLLGGLGGAFFVASQGIAVGVIGVALFIVAFTAGQSVASLVVDHVGLGPGGHEPVSRPRAVAALFAVAAVTVKVLGDLDGSHLGLSLLLASLALVAGCLQAVQQAFNGKISAIGGPLVTTWNNFLVGTSALVVLLLVSLLVPGGRRRVPHAVVVLRRRCTRHRLHRHLRGHGADPRRAGARALLDRRPGRRGGGHRGARPLRRGVVAGAAGRSAGRRRRGRRARDTAPHLTACPISLVR
ncbi:MAG: DMT family transporter [Propionibacteriales bacterium]|nr:DMT family transporter [Propionibacteriales bacterium]